MLVRRKVQLVCGWFSSRKLSRRMVVGVATNCHGYEPEWIEERRKNWITIYGGDGHQLYIDMVLR